MLVISYQSSGGRIWLLDGEPTKEDAVQLIEILFSADQNVLDYESWTEL